MKKTRVIRDPIYGYITVPAQLVVVVDHPLYQRLRRVAQTSLTSAVYPTATGTRFEHGLGAMHLAMRGFRAAWRNVRDEGVRTKFLLEVRGDEQVQVGRYASRPEALVDLIEVAVGGVGLLHDLGHPPFSHVLEPLYESLAHDHFGADPDLLSEWEDSGQAYHEFVGLRLAETILRDVRPDPLAKMISRILRADENAGTWLGVLHAIVAGEVDVDRLDYVMRDARKAGTEFGAIDYARLIDALELHDLEGGFRIAPGIRARSAVETLLLQRTQAYKWITYHPRVVGSNQALSRAVSALHALTRSAYRVGNEDNRQLAGAVFQAHWPPLNYAHPREADLKRQLDRLGQSGSEEADQLTLDDQQIASLADHLRVDMQAAIDDTVVVAALKQAGLLSQALLASGAIEPALRDQLTEFVTFQQHALFRRKNCLPAWKTVEEFDSVARNMRNDLVAAVSDAYAEVRADPVIAEVRDAAEMLQDDRDDLIKVLEDDPVIGTNRLITLLFDAEPSYIEQFQTLLGSVRPALENVRGRWDVAYTGFTSVRYGDEAAVLFDGEEELRVFESSKLAQALASVEASRFRLCAFFFVDHPARLPVSEETEAHELREKLTGDVITAFPQFVRTTLPNVLRESLKADE